MRMSRFNHTAKLLFQIPSIQPLSSVGHVILLVRKVPWFNGANSHPNKNLLYLACVTSSPTLLSTIRQTIAVV